MKNLLRDIYKILPLARSSLAQDQRPSWRHACWTVTWAANFEFFPHYRLLSPGLKGSLDSKNAASQSFSRFQYYTPSFSFRGSDSLSKCFLFYIYMARNFCLQLLCRIFAALGYLGGRVPPPWKLPIGNSQEMSHRSSLDILLAKDGCPFWNRAWGYAYYRCKPSDSVRWYQVLVRGDRACFDFYDRRRCTTYQAKLESSTIVGHLQSRSQQILVSNKF